MSSSIHTSLGVLQIGVLIAVYLFGIVTLQANIYVSTFPDDRKVFKILVATVWLLELGHTIAVCYELYKATVTHFGAPQDITNYAGYGVATIMGGTLTMLVQGFFAWRLWTVLYSPWKYIGYFCAGIEVMRCVVSLYAGVEGIRAKSIESFVEEYRGMLAALLSSGAIIDLTIAISMLWFLLVRRRKSLEKVTRLLDRLVAYTIRTGVVTSVAASAIVTLFFASPNTMLWLGFYTFLAKLYSNSLFSALNARSGLREVVGQPDISNSNKSLGRNLQINRNHPHAISIQMKTTTEMAADAGETFTVPPFQKEPSVSEHGSPEKGGSAVELDDISRYRTNV